MFGILVMMLIVALLVSSAMLVFFIWSVKTGQFDDTKKMMDGLLFDSEDDLNDAIAKEKKQEQEKQDLIINSKKL